MQTKEPRLIAHQLADTGAFPNSRLRLVVYAAALVFGDGEDAARAIEEHLHRNRWGNDWRDGIYPYHHYHSTAHEVLVVYAGWAKVQFGGDRGVIEILSRGDVVIIPAGVAHRRIDASGDFTVVGAYPEGQNWDICYGEPGERPRAEQNIARVPLPERDPIYGPNGRLLRLWERQAVGANR